MCTVCGGHGRPRTYLPLSKLSAAVSQQEVISPSASDASAVSFFEVVMQLLVIFFPSTYSLIFSVRRVTAASVRRSLSAASVPLCPRVSQAFRQDLCLLPLEHGSARRRHRTAWGSRVMSLPPFDLLRLLLIVFLQPPCV